MDLTEARGLKGEFLTNVLPRLTTAVSARAVEGPAEPFEGFEGIPETLAVGIALRGTTGFGLAIRVQRRELEHSRELEFLRQRAHGEVDVRLIGRVEKRATEWHQRRNRPLRIGGSIGHHKINAGSIGCFVAQSSHQLPLLLSNNHVLANENRARKGDPILQPGQADGGTNPDDGVATLSDFVKLKRVGINLVDCAVAQLRDGIKYNPRNLTGLGRLQHPGEVVVNIGDGVSKVGRSTGPTCGRVTAIEMDNLIVAFNIGYLRFDQQIEIEGEDGPFSRGGDSGALIVDQSCRPVALLFAGTNFGGSQNQGLTYANPFAPVLEALKVELLL
jgi:hypothetical protein